MKKTFFGLKRIVACIMILAMILSLGISVGAAPNITDMNTAVTVVDNTATVVLKGLSGEEGMITFIAAAINQTTGEVIINDDSVDTKSATNGEMTFNADISALKQEGYDIKYYLWGENNESFVNSKPNALNMDSVKTKAYVVENKITWDAVDDDFDDVYYYIYADGELIGKTQNTYFVDGRSRKLAEGKTYNYKVVPGDSYGNFADTSATQSVAVTAGKVHSWINGTYNSNDFERSVDLTDKSKSNYGGVETKAGKTAMWAKNSVATNGTSICLAFNELDKKTPYESLKVEIEYYDGDEAGGKVRLGYLYEETPDVYKSEYVDGPVLGGTGKWLKHTFVALNSKPVLYKGTKSFWGMQFSLSIASGEYDLWVSSVKVYADYSLPKNESLGKVSALSPSSGVKDVTLKWNKAESPDVKMYNVYDITDGGRKLIGEVPATGDNQYTFNVYELKSGTTYEFEVVACDENVCEGNESTKITATTKTLDVINLKPTAFGDNGVKLTWEAPPDGGPFTSYNIYDITQDSQPATPIGNVQVTDGETEFEYTDERDTLNDGDTVKYRVVPVTANGEETVTDKSEVSYRIGSADVVDLAAKNIGGKKVMLTWKAPSDGGPFTSYNIYDITQGSQPETPIGNVQVTDGETEFEYTDERDTLNDGDKVKYEVVPVYENGDEAIVSSISEYEVTVLKYILDPDFVVTTTPKANGVSLSWTTVSGATSYDVYRDGEKVATVETTSYDDRYFSTLENYLGETTNGIADGFTKETIKNEHKYYVVVNDEIRSQEASGKATPEKLVYFSVPYHENATEYSVYGKSDKDNGETSVALVKHSVTSNRLALSSPNGTPFRVLTQLDTPEPMTDNEEKDNRDYREWTTMYKYTEGLTSGDFVYVGPYKGKAAIGYVFANQTSTTSVAVKNMQYVYTGTASTADGLNPAAEEYKADDKEEYIVLFNAALENSVPKYLTSSWKIFGKSSSLTDISVVPDSEDIDITAVTTKNSSGAINGYEVSGLENINDEKQSWATYVMEFTTTKGEAADNKVLLLARKDAEQTDYATYFNTETGRQLGYHSVTVLKADDYIK